MSVEDSDLQHHLQLRPGDVGRYVLLPGDPGRCEPIARLFDEPRLVAKNREYETWTGYLDGERVSVTSTGIGCPSAAIAVEELIKVGADTFIRVGTSGAMQPGTVTGELAVITGAIRDEGTTSHYLPIEFPAVAHPAVVDALAEASRTRGARYRLGVSQSKDSFYGEVEPDRMPQPTRLHDRWDAWVAGGAVSSEMEAAAIFIIAAINRVRAGGVMRMWWDGSEDIDPVNEQLLGTAVQALRVLIRDDRAGRSWP